MLDLVEVQEVRYNSGGTEPEGDFTFFYGYCKKNHELSTKLLYMKESYNPYSGQSLLIIEYHV
jgi:hypothetical protein